MGWFEQGKKDQQQNRGPDGKNQPPSSQAKEKHDAGRAAAKQEQNQKQK